MIDIFDILKKLIVFCTYKKLFNVLLTDFILSIVTFFFYKFLE